jgi:hypothetical protein
VDRNWSITGVVLDILPDAYVISRAEDHRVCVVNRQSVRYLEIANPSREYHLGIRAGRERGV